MAARISIALILFLFTVTSCAQIYDNLGREATATERINIIDTQDQEPDIWQTGDLVVSYTIFDDNESFSLRGYVEIKDSIRYSFPRVKYFRLFIYLLDSEGVATSRYATRPRLSTYNIFPEKSLFGITIPKNKETVAFAFGYHGGFMDSENDFFGGRFSGAGSTDWEVFHTPFRRHE